MDEISDVLHEIERLVHEMVCLGKILCAKEESVRISRQHHTQETCECMEKIFGYQHRRTFISFAICSF
jgi:hypothetical protein